ncbi:hypothetical protein K4F52_002253 [Lecanicillium sp. MT-2017a]|nr:hypothetical protein K4F52_002253 [Lecanicillium sp. MT-2017a]
MTLDIDNHSNEKYYSLHYSHHDSPKTINHHLSLDANPHAHTNAYAYPYSYSLSDDYNTTDGTSWDTTQQQQQLSPEALYSALRDFATSPALMQPDAAGVYSSHLPPSLGHSSHHREPSLSSLGSAGPASPYTHNTSNPRIAITDSTSEGIPDMYSQHDGSSQHGGAYYQVAKPMDGFAGYQHLDAAAMPEMAYPMTISSHHHRPRTNRSLLPAADVNSSFVNRSHPASVASSVAGDSPATPNMGEPDHTDHGRRGRRNGMSRESSSDQSSHFSLAYGGNVPKLARTMTDVYSDELYNPNFAITSSSPAQSHNAVSPSSQVFSQRINAANSQHLSAAHSPSSSMSRAMSPFRACSPFAPPQGQDFYMNKSNGSNHGAFNPAHGMRQKSYLQQESQLARNNGDGEAEPDTPKTISPKDAVLEFNDVDGDQSFSLFPQGSGSFDFDAFGKSMGADDQTSLHMGSQHDSMSGQQQSLFPSPMPLDNRIPQHYPFVSRTQAVQEMTPPRLSSSSSSSVEPDGSVPGNGNRPSRPGAETGTYTCTYHGCTLRFDTPAQLQKHKREGHRQTQTLGVPRVPDTGVTAGSLLNSQAGPHRCDRINPSTGKPCGTVFSRPYDLTRHEDTIHNGKKIKVRCDLCTVEKTFSRADALTRHYRVCHPEAELPGKLRRRG